MLNNKTFLAIIPARAGSKRLPNKNILDLNGKPLVAYTIEAATHSKYIDKIVVSSDSDNVLKITEYYNVDRIKRPQKLATDSTTTFDAIKHALYEYNQYDFIIILQPTSPLRTSKHIDEAIELLYKKQADAIISVCEVEHSPLWSNILPDNGDMSNFLSKDSHKRSQDLQTYYRLNGAIYICNTVKYLSEQTAFLENNIFSYIMPQDASVDIDTNLDFTLASIIQKRILKSCQI